MKFLLRVRADIELLQTDELRWIDFVRENFSGKILSFG
jgi:hypothetical protein